MSAGRPGGLRAALRLLLLAALAFAVGVALFDLLLMPRLIHGAREVRVPDLAQLTLEQAEQALAPTGLPLSRAGERFDPQVPRGAVIAQDPPAGTAVRGRRRVSVIVSLGEEFSSVPPLFGASLRGARAMVERAGLVVGDITRAPSEEVGEGLVAASDPPAESVLPRDAAVSLLVSTGAGAEAWVMPVLLGRDLAAVRRQLEALGFLVVVPPGAGGRGMILSQDPAPGLRIARGATVTLQGTGGSRP